MIKTALEIPPLSRDVADYELDDYGKGRRLRDLEGVRVISDHQSGIRLVWAVEGESPSGVRLKPHEALALGKLLLDAVDDVSPVRRGLA